LLLSVGFVTEEYRRYRVRAEVRAKELEGRVRRGERREVENVVGKEDKSKGDEGGEERLRDEIKEQDAQWREAYDNLLRENEGLRKKGMEAEVARQWRVRYEKEVREKEELGDRLRIAEARVEGGGRQGRGEEDDLRGKNWAEVRLDKERSDELTTP